MMNCEVCNQGPMQGISVYRGGPKGQKVPWYCEAHLSPESRPDAETLEIVHILEDKEV